MANASGIVDFISNLIVTGIGDLAIAVELLGVVAVLVALGIGLSPYMLRTLPSPGLNQVIVLGTVAVLRTVLGLSLEYELRQMLGGTSGPGRGRA